jgi:acyl-[acyl-carrier-protein]-phospholipid O-acyltransferase/long-chain-fatty-acid--[acyl-carrier-protein] ligase
MMELDVLNLEKLKYSLFLRRRFLPIFLATSLGAFNDNLLRSGLVVLIAYATIKGIDLPTRPEILVTICSALLVIPMLLFSFIAGQIADKYEKSKLVIFTKLAEVGIMACVYYGFETRNIYLLMVMLFISGTHSTFYGPIKFSILPDHLKKNELLAGNGFMAGGSYLAILLGMVTGGLLVEMPGNLIGLTAFCISLIGLFASLRIPRSKPAHPQMVINYDIYHGSKDMIKSAMQTKTLMYSIFALSWFLLIGSVFMSQFPNYAQGVVKGDNGVYILFLTTFSIGIAIGSLLCDTLLGGIISGKLTRWAALGVSIFTYGMILLTPEVEHEGLVTAGDYIANSRHWPVLFCTMMTAVCGGMYMVPLYALLQSQTMATHRSRVLAASNFSDSIFITFAALVSALLLYYGLDVKDLFVVLATTNLLAVWYARKIT